LQAGTLIGSGTVSNDDPKAGSSCLVEKRTLEILQDGKASTPYMTSSDQVEIWMENEEGKNIFGRIFQQVVSR
jgi:fumarylacetoacetate (FAA) hydrolase